MNEPALIREMLALKTIAVVGLSDRPDRPSYAVSEYMLRHGYRITPVNPALCERRVSVFGQTAYSDLATLPERPDMVQVFRNVSFLPAILDEMLRLGLKHLWTQQGIVDLPTAACAEAHAIRVVMDRCMKTEHHRLSQQ